MVELTVVSGQVCARRHLAGAFLLWLRTQELIHNADKGKKKRKSSSQDSSIGDDRIKQKRKKAMSQAAGAMKSELATFGFKEAEDSGKKTWDDFKKEDPEVITI